MRWREQTNGIRETGKSENESGKGSVNRSVDPTDRGSKQQLHFPNVHNIIISGTN
jgi:hypothetical protein